MEVSSSMLVAIMSITILSLGIANILMTLASFVNPRTKLITYSIHTAWLILLLMVQFNVFWHIIDIFAVEDWMFLDFLYVLAGPIILFFGTHVLLPQGKMDIEMEAHYFAVNRVFFVLFALLQAWGLGVDFLLLKGWTVMGSFNVLGFLIALGLAATISKLVHRVGTVAAWLLYLGTTLFFGLATEP